MTAARDRILVIDDNPDNLDLLSRRLGRRGYIVERETNGLDAIARLDRDRFDLALLDIMMPGIDGFETLRRIRLTHSEAELPVIMVTADQRSDSISAALRAGANDYVEKPIDMMVLQARMGAQLRRARAERELREMNESLEQRVRDRTEALETSEAYLKSVIENAPDAVVTIDTHGIIQSFNPMGTTIFGYSADDVIGRNVTILMTGDDKARHDERLSQFVSGESPGGIIGATGREVLARRKSGEIFNAELTIGEINTGTAREFVGILRDITERKKAIEQFQILAENGSDLICLHDEDGRCKYVSPSSLSVLGTHPDELVGRSLADCVLENDREKLKAALSPSVLQGNGSSYVKVRVPTEADGVKWLEIFATRREGGSTDFATSSRDVTERVEIESRLLQSQKLEAIGQLTGGVAHDFNNLLTVIMGNIQLLSRNLQCDQKTATHLERIMGAAKSGSQLTRSLLTFSRQQVLDTSDVDIDDVLHGMKELLSRTMGDNIEIAIATCDRPCYGHTDKHQLESAVLNMCINARDAMPNGGRLTLESRPAILDEHYAATHASVLPGRYIEIAVTDTGTGMPPDILEHIFEPFFTTKSENKGTGLGLSTIYGFMKQSGGHVAAYSEPGQGTTFKLYVPVGNAAGVSEETRPGGEKKSNAEIKGLALVVEDDESVREIAIDVLSSIGLRVIDAHDAADGIEKFRQNPEIAIVFSDIVMPGDMTGVDLANTIREMSPDVPIVLASGYAEQASRRNNGIPHGVKFLAKPYDIGVLETLVKEMLETGNGRDGPRKVQH